MGVTEITNPVELESLMEHFVIPRERDREVLVGQFKALVGSGSVVVLGVKEGPELVAFSILQDPGPPYAWIVQFWSKPGNTRAIALGLLDESAKWARARGRISMLFETTRPDAMMRVVPQFKPYSTVLEYPLTE